MKETGKFVWHELITDDIEGAKRFYSEVIGWRLGSMEMPGGVSYSLLKAGEAPVGGVVPPPKKGIAPHWVGYVSVPNVDDAAAAVRRAGGKALMDAFDVPSVGRMQPVADPDGAPFFLFASLESGPGVEGEGSFHWDELTTRDVPRALRFYREALGYGDEVMQMPHGDYHVLKQGDVQCAGLMATADAVSRWHTYVTVGDVDAALARSRRLGGKTIADPMEVPGVGRFATLSDPSGAALGIIVPAQR